MQDIIYFISTHYRLIIEGVLLVVSVLFFILRKKPINDILSYIYQACLKATIDVENSGIKGPDEKLAFCVEIVTNTLKVYFPGLDIKPYSALIVSIIELVLETPHKHSKVK